MFLFNCFNKIKPGYILKFIPDLFYKAHCTEGNEKVIHLFILHVFSMTCMIWYWCPCKCIL